MAEHTFSPELLAARYISLATFRRNGREVRTPVWAAPLDGVLYCFSAGEAGKVKRLRAGSRARIARCNMRGGDLGEWVDAQAHLVTDPDLIERVLSALRQRYGWSMRFADAGARLTGRFHRRAYIRIAPAD